MRPTALTGSLPSRRSDEIVPRALPIPFGMGSGFSVLSLVLPLILLLFPLSLCSQVAGAGTSFTVVLPYTSPSSTPSQEKIRLYLTGAPGTQVQMRYGEGGPGVITRVIPVGGFLQENLDTNDLMLPRAQGIFRRQLKVAATDPVTVAVLLDRGTASEAYAAIPDSLCGFEYVAVAETSLISGSFVTVAALDDRTDVRITPSVPTRNGNPPGVPFTVRLNRGDVYQLMSAQRIDVEEEDDLSGTRVLASNPVVVHSGATCVVLPVGSNISCAPLLEQLPHVDALGRTHVLPLFREEERTIMRAVPFCDPVTLRSNDLLPPFSLSLPPDQGTNVEAFGPGLVTSSGPVLLAHLGTNVSKRPPAGLDGPVGDPTMSILVPEEEMDTLYRFVVPALTGRVDGGAGYPWLHFVTVTRTRFSTTARLNGRPLRFNGLVADTMVDPGLFTLESEGVVSVTVNGRSVSDAYAFVPGIVRNRFEIVSDTLVGIACFSGFDTVVTIRNRGPAAITINRIAFPEEIVGSPGLSLPITIARGDSFDLPLRFEGSLDSVSSRISLYNGTGSCAQRIGTIPLRLRGMSLALDPPRGSLIRFPDLRPPDRTWDTVVTVRNTGSDTIDIIEILLQPDRFVLPNGEESFRLLPGESREIVVRFAPEPGDDLLDGSLRFRTAPCPEDTLWTIRLQGKVRYYDVTAPVELADTTYCGVVRTDTLTAVVANRESVPLRIDSIRIIGGDPGEFRLEAPASEPTVIGAEETLQVRVVYTPGPSGRREARLQMWGPLVDFSPIDLPLVVHAEQYAFAFVPADLAFGPVKCDTVAGRRVVLRNRGTVPLRGFDVELLRQSAFLLRREGDDPPGAGEEISFVVEPIGPPGLHRDTLRFVDSVCGTDLLMPVSVLCTDSGAIRLELGDRAGEVGERVEIPLRIERGRSGFGTGVPFVLDLRLRFRADLLHVVEPLVNVPAGVSSAVTGRSTDGPERLLDLRLSGTIPPGGELGQIAGTLLLGEETTSPVAFESARFVFDVPTNYFRVGLTTRDGSVSVSGYCEVGGTRFVRSSGSFGMKIVAQPDRAETRLLVDLVEDGPVTIDLYDPLGRRIATLWHGMPGPGRWAIPLEVDGTAQGFYYVRLRTETAELVASLVIRPE